MKKWLLGITVFAASILAVHYYHVHHNYRFSSVDGKEVFRSGVIPPEKIGRYVKRNNIKTVIDLRDGNFQSALNPARQEEIQQEREAIQALEDVNYVNLPSRQIPNESNLASFFALMDNQDNYPILIHCHHGTGRAVLYSALYKMKYKGYSGEKARKRSRILTKWSAFDKRKKKGKYLRSLTPEDLVITSTAQIK